MPDAMMYASSGAETEITIGNIPHKVNILLTPTTQRRKKKEKQFKSLEHKIRWRLLRLNQTPTVDLLFLQRWLTKQDPLCSSKNRKRTALSKYWFQIKTNHIINYRKILSSGKTEISSPAKLCRHQVSQVVMQVKILIFSFNFSRYKAK